ncbi:SDR family NAD(P)-dependent oxidoreductase [Pseudoalteromonas sp. MMG022]|uniref:SDR family NAD(P)-dependent oxidoreductase n=1 Tax=Pseudoalteromonas sp. MMG022 TaxID=2909978 RepID=UPI001F3A2F38|nr:SDR family NAD(P)-dependent oxidoreductase [Pseudoalteromonas sp. MMG022]MCF6434292.1 SDR family NAD(P)-dependent oxidoreductase [Pseudoalteromonas sp. MMG022]
MTNSAIIIIGASSAIAKAFISEQHKRYPQHPIITISRSALEDLSEYDDACQSESFKAFHEHIVCDNSPVEITKTVKTIAAQITNAQSVTIFNGQLHNAHFKPEKRLEDIHSDYLQWLFQVNTITPLLWLKYIGEHLGHSSKCVLTCLSARVASIDDNSLGGWYGYRASKAALNMAVKTFAIELARRAKHCKCVLFHPGTTDTPLSKPFQKNVPNGKLFDPQFVAGQLSDLLTQRVINGQVDYIDWQGKAINW